LIEQKMADLVAMQQLLGGLVRQCDAGDGGAMCTVIETLTRESCLGETIDRGSIVPEGIQNAFAITRSAIRS
jgi:hypothetical protein